MNEEELYYQVIEELKNNRLVMRLWEAALQNNDNNPMDAEDEYIRMRIVQLQQKQAHLAVTQEEFVNIVMPPSVSGNVTEEDGFGSDDIKNYQAEVHGSSTRKLGSLLGITVLFLLVVMGMAITYLLYLYLT